MECPACGCKHFYPISPVEEKTFRGAKMRIQRKRCRNCGKEMTHREEVPVKGEDPASRA